MTDSKYSKWHLPYKPAKEFDKRTAYFSMEFGIHQALKIYSGGLGVLSGDHLKAASDLGLPLIGFGLLYKYGYFSQNLQSFVLLVV